EHHDEWLQDWMDFKIPEGESAREVFDRNVQAVDDIINKHKQGKVALVTHLGVVRNITAYLLGMTLEGSWHFRVSNGSITRIQVDDGYGVMISLNEK
ncbi:MAG: histidine phosphatase family protein, partial [Clostridia bacterium]